MLDEIEKTYDDICIMQNYSEAVSRNDADISVKYRYGSSIYSTRNPIIVSPMIHTASKKMITQSLFNGMIFVMHRYFKTPEEQITAVLETLSEETFSSNYWLDLKTLYFAVGQCTKWIDHLYGRGVRNFCCDFSHGYSLQCINTIKYIKALDKDNHVMAGNVETYDGYMTLCKCGADMIRVGIASGCFTADMEVMTSSGLKKISDIKNGDLVKTHNNRYRKVINTLSYYSDAAIIQINNKIKCTPNHEIYIIDKNNKHKVNESNIHKFARWIRADELTNDMLLIELQ